MQAKYEVRPTSVRGPGNGKRWISGRFGSLLAVLASYAPLFGIVSPTSGELISELRGRIQKNWYMGQSSQSVLYQKNCPVLRGAR